MVAASVWSLLIPSIEMRAESSSWSVLPAAIGFLAGVSKMKAVGYLGDAQLRGSQEERSLRQIHLLCLWLRL